jgi:ATP-dependent Clp protease protease subunit
MKDIVQNPKPTLDSINSILEWEDLSAGIIRFSGEIWDEDPTDLAPKLEYIKKRKLKTFRMYLNSPGGNVYSSMAIHDAIKELSKSGIKTECVVEGYAASAASMIILQAFDKRYSRKNARLLIHEPRQWSVFQVKKTSDMKDDLKEMETLEKMIFDIMAPRCNKTPKELKKTIERKETWFSAEEAKDFGLIDKVI